MHETSLPDLAAARSYLVERGLASSGDVTLAGTGSWSVAYGFESAEGAPLVIRFGGVRDDFDRDLRATALASPQLPIPRTFEVGEALGGFFAISERLDGRFLDELDGAAMRAVLPSLLQTLDAIRDADVSATTGYGSWDATGYGAFGSWAEMLSDIGSDPPGGRIAGWRARLAASPIGVEPFDRALAKLRALAPRLAVERHLIHCDLLYHNVFVRDDRISGVIDWGCAMYGDLLYDPAWIVFWMPWYRDWDGIAFESALRRHHREIGLEVPDFDDRLRACALHIGLASQAYQAYIGDWKHLEWSARRTLEFVR
jgi:hygromycin-B 4-O-kinase